MIDKLPYTLTTGVTATREGLVMHDSIPPMYDVLRAIITPEPMIAPHEDGTRVYTWPWPDVAHRLRYREGEPWCHVYTDEDGDEDIVCRFGTPWPGIADGLLHRLAAILCDDAEAFRVLHWCVSNLGATA